MPQLPIFGFGSLLDSKSLTATVPDAQNIIPVYVKGFRRDFSFWDPTGWTETNLDLAGEAFCAVDAIVSADPGTRTNGIIFQVSQTSHERLLLREAGYELVKTQAYDFKNDRLLGECLLFSSNKNDGAYDFKSLAQKRYLEVCLRGASRFGHGFYKEFINTTFINGQRLREVDSLTKILNKYGQTST